MIASGFSELRQQVVRALTAVVERHRFKRIQPFTGFDGVNVRSHDESPREKRRRFAAVAWRISAAWSKTNSIRLPGKYLFYVLQIILVLGLNILYLLFNRINQPMTAVELDEFSLRILDALQENADISNADLAERIGLSPSPCYRRVADLKQNGVIRRSVVLVDPARLGLALNVFVHVSLKNQDKDSLEVFTRAIEQRSEVMECYLMSGEADFLLRVAIEDLKQYQALLLECLTQIPCVANIRSSFALNQVKYTTALPTGHLR